MAKDKLDPKKMLSDLKKRTRTEAPGYGTHKEKMAAASRARSESGRDIGPLPPVADRARKDACGQSLRLFCETYFRAKFYLNWSPDHLTVIDRLERCVRHGGLFSLAMPRGNGKTELSKRAAEWGILYGYRRFIVVVGATETDADHVMKDIKASFEANDLLNADFPEACYPVRKLEGIVNRSAGQTLDGVRTLIVWKDHEIRLPRVAGAASSGAIIRTAGLTGSIRGASATAADGGTVRPDLVIADDPQTRESAGSPKQNADREAIIRGDVLGLAGPRRKISCIMPCTVIYPGDLADRLLDRGRNPQWQGLRMRRVQAFPTNEALWQRYAELRADGFRAGDEGRAATEFYLENRAAMDAGAVVSWPERYDPEHAASALQEAMNRRIDDPKAFAAEDQNDPETEGPEGGRPLVAAEVAARGTNLPRGTAPRTSTRLTAMIDVGAHLLWYAVTAWDERFGGVVVDYGAFPDQSRPYFTAADARPTLADLPGAAGRPQDATLYAGLEALADRVAGHTYTREETGEALRVERCLIDANWGPGTDLVYEFCRRSRHAGILLPSHGKFFGATSNPMSSWQHREGERAGPGWRLSPFGARRGRHIVFDTNYWKTFLAERLRTGTGGAGCLALFDDKRGAHAMLGDHCAAEVPVPATNKGGRTVEEWKEIPGRDNHLLDCLVGCCVGASIQGLTWQAAAAAGAPPAERRRKKVDVEELYRKQRGQ